MNKIIKALLESKFSNVNVDAILEVINASPNPQIATEILCGLYEETKIEHKLVKSKNTSEGVLTFSNYDKWTDKVHYSYMSPETRGAYFPKGTKKEDVSIDKFESMKINSSNDAEYLHIPTGEMKKCTSYMSSDTWNNLLPVETV